MDQLLRKEFKEIIRWKNMMDHAKARNDLTGMKNAVSGFVSALEDAERSGSIDRMTEYETFVMEAVTKEGYKFATEVASSKILELNTPEHRKLISVISAYKRKRKLKFPSVREMANGFRF